MGDKMYSINKESCI